MARTRINFDKKKQEIVHLVWEILLKYGYEQMTISVIIDELSISKGAFYHYFQSKEECVEQAITEYVTSLVTSLKDMDNHEDTASYRLQRAIYNAIALFHKNNEQNQIINKPENLVFHQKLMIAFTKLLAQFYADIIISGIKSKEFQTNYPLEIAQMLLTLSNFYLDAALFQWEEESIQRKIEALEELANNALGTKEYVKFFSFENKGQSHG